MKVSICPLSVAVFLGTAYYMTQHVQRKRDRRDGSGHDKKGKDEEDDEDETLPSCQVVFVLGGPGSGKGTQCQLLVERLESRWSHLSTGDLLRAERKKGGELGDQINTIIANGKLVPSEITCQLLEKGMKDVYNQAQSSSSSCTKFLIDGYPRSFGNVSAWDKMMGSKHQIEFVLYLDCPEEVMIGRLLERGKSSGRSDDSIDVIRKRFETNARECAPVIEHYEKHGQLRKVVADKPIEDVYKEVEKLFVNL